METRIEKTRNCHMNFIQKISKLCAITMPTLTVLCVIPLVLMNCSRYHKYRVNELESNDGLHIIKRGEIIVPKDGFVPDEKTAVKIAEAVLLAVMGPDISKEFPLKAELMDNGIWHVYRDPYAKEGFIRVSTGGLIITIRKSDGRIMECGIIHDI